MQLKNIEFLKQFRIKHKGLPGEEKMFGTIYFRHFKMGRKENSRLERVLGNKLTQSALIGELVIKMEREDQVISRRLADLMKKLQRVLATPSRREPYPRPFVARLTAEAGRFSKLAGLYGDKVQLPLLNSLRDILAMDQNSAESYLDSDAIRYIRDAVRQYLSDIYHYHDVFAGLLEEEYGRTGASAVSTPVEASLLKLTTLMKSQLFAIEATVKYLNKWGKRTLEMEVQAIYN